ncbi:MAG: pyridoxal phosphate-dependent aminotransferase [Ignavibacteriales bacterium]|nr:pyridoxal phosphate-dependent aminotransferase [Ignavibacteriales bacterium]
MFSTRTDWDLRPSPLFTLLQQKRASGEELLDLTESNPTKCGFIHHSSKLVGPESLQRSMLYEPDPKGLLSARQAISDWYKRQNISVTPDRIILASSTSEAYSFLFRLLCNVGDVVAVPKPSYPLFEYLARLNDVLCQDYRLAYDGEWHVDLSSVDEALSSNAEALILVHPNNPTGSFVKKEERDRIVSEARARKIPIIVDEVFSAFSFANDERCAVSFAGTESTLTFTLNGMSKLLGLPQMKLAWIVVSGPDEECAKAVQRLEVIADTYLSVGTAVQQALPQLLNNPEAMTQKILTRTRSNYESLRTACAAGSPATLLHCEGAWNAILCLPAKRSDEEWALELLQSLGVLTHPGHLFDIEAKSCIVVSLLPEHKVFSEGIRRILAAVE